MRHIPCKYFASGKCNRGNDCKFSHDLGSSETSNTASSSRNPATINRKDQDGDELREVLKRWRFSIPRTKLSARPLGDNALGVFYEQALKLVGAGGEHMQAVITALASEEGLCRVRELFNRTWEDMNDSVLHRCWNTLILPYFGLLSHEAVVQSTVIEVRYATLLNDLYGIGGRQASSVFKASVRYLCQNPQQEACATSIAVLAYMLERNESAKVNPEIQAVGETLLALLETDSLPRSTERHIHSIRLRLRLGSAIPNVLNRSANNRFDGPRPTFTVSQDLPGELSADGPRHDNDSACIGSISILPTFQEIQSCRMEYLPRDDPDEWHLPGLAGLIDRHFRLVREDTVGQLRDAAKSELGRLRDPDGTATRKEQNGARTNSYLNLQLEDVVFDKRRGMLFILSFDQPKHLNVVSRKERQAWWDDSMRLNPDSLICLLSSAGHATFLVVYAPGDQSQDKGKQQNSILEKYTLARDPKRATVVAQLTSKDPEDTMQFLQSFATSSTGTVRWSLVEFPGVVLAAFGPTLEALQCMAESLDLPFVDCLVPGGTRVPHPPAYSQRPGFNFNLTSLLSEGERLLPLQGAAPGGEDMQAILARSALDETQRKAVDHALKHDLALIQGPPGTGKSYTGVKLIQALLDNKQAGRIGPIVCVCFTNHALDQLLEHLLDVGVKQIIRVGGRSKSTRLAQLNLRTIVSKSGSTKYEREQHGNARRSMEDTADQIGSLLSRLSGLTSSREDTVLGFLQKENPSLYAQLLSYGHGTEDDGFQPAVTADNVSLLRLWLQGGISQHGIAQRPIEDLQSGLIDLAGMSQEERTVLFDSWVNTISAEIYAELELQLDFYNNDNDQLVSIRNESDLRMLSTANVIGITTSGLARQRKLLWKLPSKVLVVEEAGEVLEAHLLTAMLPSLEHAILIGDHQQLRPKVQNYELSVENMRSQIALDVSLFERLIRPRGERTSSLPYVTLETQRRMHPSISELIRSTLYPNLKDAPSVLHPPVVGMRRRIFWLDHRKKEDGKNEHLHSTSHTNSFEVEMVAALVRHLQRQGVYTASDIAVLTPYLGQLRRLRQKLNSFIDIILNDRDVDGLAQESDEASHSMADDTMPRPSVTKGRLSDALRLATVDNFQGEEAKVVIISLVRSNDQRKCGFLRTSNRINVLLSRAQHGMYLIGNSETSSNVDMWRDVIEIFKAKNNFGTALELSCPRHPSIPLQIREPEDFSRVSPEAGCDLMCGEQLICGHACPSKCHSESLHRAVFCMKDCNRLKKGCEHACRLPCGEKCEPRCNEIVQCDVQLDCGHVVSTLPCWLYQDQSQIKCDVLVTRVIPGCEHHVNIECFVRVDDPNFLCREICSTDLDCGHSCEKPCFTCRSRSTDTAVAKIDHGKCTRRCGRDYNSCEHSCKELCHPGSDCQLCKEPCSVQCAHSKCSRLCSEPCLPCNEETCASCCSHSACQMPCAAPCDSVPCSRRCEKQLSCGHQCPSLCGELCPSSELCQICCSDEIKDQRVDLFTFEAYKDIDLSATPCLFLPCGHVFTVDTLDGQLGMSSHYEMSEDQRPQAIKGTSDPTLAEQMKTCPDCRGSLRPIARYGRIVRQAMLDIGTKKFITWSNRAYIPLAEKLQKVQETLLDNPGDVMLSDNIRIVKENDLPKVLKAMASRYGMASNLRKDIQGFFSKVRKEEQPYQKVRDLVEATRRRQRAQVGPEIPQFEFDQTVLQTRGQLLAKALLIRCDLIIISDLVRMWEGQPLRIRSSMQFIIDLSMHREHCLDLLELAKKSMNVLQQAESCIFWAQFAAVECSSRYTNTDNEDKTQSVVVLKQEAHARLEQAAELCKTYPGQTSNVVFEVDSVRKMLDDSIGSSEMRMIVAAMEKEFSGTGHWYRCINQHPFTVGECGGPMQQTLCPQCGAPVGGRHHVAAEGVQRADDIEREFGSLQL